MARPSVLIIDDGVDTRANLRDILELDEYQVDETESVSGALAGRDLSGYLAILLDWGLPEATISVMTALRRLAPRSAMIVVTARSDISAAIEALRQGAADYLLKPIDASEVRVRLGRIAEHRRLEDERRESDRFARSVLDSLSANVSVVDDSGAIVAVNRAWRQFAAENGGAHASVAEGADYFDVCARATGSDADTARRFLAGILAVLSGASEYFEKEYPCHSPDRQRWFVGQVTPFHADGPRKVVVAHVDISDRKRTEAALRESTMRLQALSRRVVEVQEEERRHVARELHDEIGQVLSAVSVNLRALKENRNAAAEQRIEESIDIVDQATQQVRNLSLDLRPSMIDDLGLFATLRWYADRHAQRAGFVVVLRADPSINPLPNELALACFRVAQEALTNVARHASARKVGIELRHRDGEVQLVISDDGAGFDPEIARRGAARGESFGLMGIEERVGLLGGRFEIQSQRGHGTKIRVRFPIEWPTTTPAESGGSGP